MSFRYTNNLVGALKHRLMLEATHRELVRRTFVGTCDGIEVTCSGFGTVKAIRMIDKPTWEPLYRKKSGVLATVASAVSSTGEAAEGEATSSATAGGLDLVKLATSIQAATHDAIRKLRAAKEEAHHRSHVHNTQIRERGELRHWYEQDANSILPRSYDALKQELGTPWMQVVRFGKANRVEYLNGVAATSNATGVKHAESAAAAATAKKPVIAGGTWGGGVPVLSLADCEPANIPIGSVHPLFTPGLVQLELDAAASAVASPQENPSQVDEKVVLSEQRKEMCIEEQDFWERVELIRRGQLATIRHGGAKRGYADQSSTIKDDVEDKIQLKFMKA